MAFAATPITSICKKPIESVDSFFSEKVDAIECAFPVLSKPTEVLTSQAKDAYDKNVKQPIEQFYTAKEKQLEDIKSYGANKVHSVVKAGTDSIEQWGSYGINVMDNVLDNKLAKIITEPVLNFTEKSLDYWIPSQDVSANPNQRTLRRIYDINNRVYKHLYQSTFTQLNRLHIQFENTIKRLQFIKQACEMGWNETKDKLNSACNNFTNNSLVKQCALVIEKNKLSLQQLDTIARGYYNVILTDVTQILEKYLTLVKNFPVSFNGTHLLQKIHNLRNQLNKESFSSYLNLSIESLKTIHQALLSYTNQMFQVVNDSRLMQLLNAKSVESKSELPTITTTTTATNKTGQQNNAANNKSTANGNRK